MFGRRSKPKAHPKISATPGEISVVTAILSSSGDPRAEPLLAQFSAPNRIRRTIEGRVLRVEVDFATSDMSVTLDRDVSSRPVRLEDARTGIPLHFVLELSAGGYVRELRGESQGWDWPDLWSLRAASLPTAAEGSLRLPPSAEVPVHEVTDLMQVAMPERAQEWSTCAPATLLELNELEARMDAEFPGGLVQLLQTSNGMIVPPAAVFGTRDLYLAEVPELGRHWVIGQVGLDEVVIWDARRGVLATRTPQDPDSWRVRGTTYEEWITGLLTD